MKQRPIVNHRRRNHMMKLPIQKLNDFCKKRNLYIVVENGLFLNFRNESHV